jgi:hypothetical protein
VTSDYCSCDAAAREERDGGGGDEGCRKRAIALLVKSPLSESDAVVDVHISPIWVW